MATHTKWVHVFWLCAAFFVLPAISQCPASSETMVSSTTTSFSNCNSPASSFLFSIFGGESLSLTDFVAANITVEILNPIASQRLDMARVSARQSGIKLVGDFSGVAVTGTDLSGQCDYLHAPNCSALVTFEGSMTSVSVTLTNPELTPGTHDHMPTGLVYWSRASSVDGANVVVNGLKVIPPPLLIAPEAMSMVHFDGAARANVSTSRVTVLVEDTTIDVANREHFKLLRVEGRQLHHSVLTVQNVTMKLRGYSARNHGSCFLSLYSAFLQNVSMSIAQSQIDFRSDRYLESDFSGIELVSGAADASEMRIEDYTYTGNNEGSSDFRILRFYKSDFSDLDATLNRVTGVASCQNHSINPIYIGYVRATRMSITATDIVQNATARKCDVPLLHITGSSTVTDGLHVRFSKVEHRVLRHSSQIGPVSSLFHISSGLIKNSSFTLEDIKTNCEGASLFEPSPICGTISQNDGALEDVNLSVRRATIVATAIAVGVINLNLAQLNGTTGIHLTDIHAEATAMATASLITISEGGHADFINIKLERLSGFLVGQMHCTALFYFANKVDITESRVEISDVTAAITGTYNALVAGMGRDQFIASYGTEPIAGGAIVATALGARMGDIVVSIERYYGPVVGFRFVSAVDLTLNTTAQNLRVVIRDSNFTMDTQDARENFTSGLLTSVLNSVVLSSTFSVHNTSMEIAGKDAVTGFRFSEDMPASVELTSSSLKLTSRGGSAVLIDAYVAMKDVQVAIANRSVVMITADAGTAGLVKLDSNAGGKASSLSMTAVDSELRASSSGASLLVNAVGPSHDLSFSLTKCVLGFGGTGRASAVSAIRDSWTGSVTLDTVRLDTASLADANQLSLLTVSPSASPAPSATFRIGLNEVRMDTDDVSLTQVEQGNAMSNTLVAARIATSCVLWPNRRLARTADYPNIRQQDVHAEPLSFAQQRATCGEATRTATSSYTPVYRPPPPTATRIATRSATASRSMTKSAAAVQQPVCSTSELRAVGIPSEELSARLRQENGTADETVLLKDDQPSISEKDFQETGLSVVLHLTNASGVWFGEMGASAMNVRCEGVSDNDRTACDALLATRDEDTRMSASGETVVITFEPVPLGLGDDVTITIKLPTASFGCAEPPATVREAQVVIHPDRSSTVETEAALTTAVAVNGAIVAVTGGAGGTTADAQALAVFSLISCSSGDDRYAMKRAHILLSPSSIGSGPEGHLIFNLTVVFGLLGLQLFLLCAVFGYKKYIRKSQVVSFAIIQADIRFPSFFIVLAGIFHQGTAILSLRLIFDGKFSFASVLGILLTMVFPWGLYVFVWRLTRPSFAEDVSQRLAFFKYVDVEERLPVSIRTFVMTYLFPVGRWGPSIMRKRYGGPVRGLLPLWTGFGAFDAMIRTAVCIVAALSPGSRAGCMTQYATLIFTFVASAGSVAYLRPYRSWFLNWAQVLSSTILALELFLSALLAANSNDDVRSAKLVVTTLLTILSYVRGIYHYSFVLIERCFFRKNSTKTYWSECRDDTKTSELYKRLVVHDSLAGAVIGETAKVHKQEDLDFLSSELQTNLLSNLELVTDDNKGKTATREKKISGEFRSTGGTVTPSTENGPQVLV